jgi:3-hydroxyacyl-[acyl-carrier-protein] dehydratase
MPRPSTLDRVVCVSADEGRALRNVPSTLPVLDTHFPRFPVLPGVMILETLAELAASVAGAGFALAGAQRLRFRRYVRPGDQMELTVRVLERSDAAVAVSGEVRVAGRVVMTAQRLEMTAGAAR